MPPPAQYGDLDESQPLVDPDHFARDGEDLFDISGEKPRPTPLTRLNSVRRRLLTNVLRNPKAHLVNTVLFLLPSFVVEPLRNYSTSTRPVAPKPPLSSTAWLDGLRGIAALTVYIFHWSMLWFSDILTDAYGAPGSANTIFQLPIIRTFNSGTASVAVFFVISGYVITIKTLSTIYQGGPQNNERVLSTLCGALFRRPFRLFGPAIVSTFIIAVVNQRTGILAYSVHRLPDLHSQLTDWFHETLKMMNTFNLHRTRYSTPLPLYNNHLWTIPLEFKNSVLVFTLLLAFSKVKRWIHLMGVAGVAWCLLDSQGDIDAALFCYGLFLAEITLIIPPPSQRGRGSSTPSSKQVASFEDNHAHGNILYWTGHFITITFAITGLHLMGYPLKENVQVSGFRTISNWTPKPFYPGEGSVPLGQTVWSIGVGAMLYITACTYSAPLRLPPHISRWIPMGISRQRGQQDRSDATTTTAAETTLSHTPFLQIPHTTRFAQYLGWLSYSLYLCHGSVITGMGLKVYQQARPNWEAADEFAKQLVISGQTMAAAEIAGTAWRAYVFAFLWTSVLQSIVLFWISDVFARAIDANMVKMTRWVWGASKTD